MTTRKIDFISAAVFVSAVLLHLLIITVAFMHFSPRQPLPAQTRFVMHSIPKPPAPPVARPPQKPKPKPIASKPAPDSLSVPEEAPLPVQDETLPETEDAPPSDEPFVENAGDSLLVDFKALIVQKIAENKIYPKAARKHNQEGNVTVSIVVLKSGKLAQAEIVNPCGYKFLNEAALASVRSAAPFYLGESAPDQIELTVTLEYRLEG